MTSFEELAAAAAREEALLPEPQPILVDEAVPVIDIDAPPKPRYPEYAGHPDDDAPVQVGIEGVDALQHFFGQLTLTDLRRERAITRAGHWGDSVLGGDGLTHALRVKLQARFGDAGHGFHALSRYGVGYSHRGIRFQDHGAWRSCEIIFKCRSDGRYGYAGVTSESSAGGASHFRTAKRGPGSKVSHFELWYMKRPGGGNFQLRIDGNLMDTIATSSDRVEDAVDVFEVPDGEHSFQLRATGGGVSRGYGVVLERDGPGVVWDELSLIGSFTQRLDYQDPAHLAWQLNRRDVDLMVFMFGGNDVQREFEDLKHRMTPYEQEYAQVIRKFKVGRPHASCMIMSLIDHGKRVGRQIQTRDIVPRLVASQRKVALAEGCAFFDTFQAMGGEGSISRWYSARPALAAPDLSHPSPAGQKVIATLVYRALMKEYAGFRRRHEGDPLPEP
jgi:lysophospholipase L1-like esterase